MALETSTYIDGLVATNPVATDGLSQSDDHHRLIKSTIKATFPAITGAVTCTHTELNALDGYTGTVTNLNVLSGTAVTPTEFSYLDGVTSAIQTQINAISTELVTDTSPQLGAALDTNGHAIQFGTSKWTIVLDGTDLDFKYNGTTVFKLASTGAVTSANEITAFGSP